MKITSMARQRFLERLLLNRACSKYRIRTATQGKIYNGTGCGQDVDMAEVVEAMDSRDTAVKVVTDGAEYGPC